MEPVSFWSFFLSCSRLLPAEPREDYARHWVKEASFDFRLTDPWKGSFLQPSDPSLLPPNRSL